ncbi:MAG: hypothetical protein LBE18_09465 [Planctomycetaceae bacterium]|nr:hypothetical protein [Planctomycetaceae bacterium]
MKLAADLTYKSQAVVFKHFFGQTIINHTVRFSIINGTIVIIVQLLLIQVWKSDKYHLYQLL